MSEEHLVKYPDPILTTPCADFDFKNPPVDPNKCASALVETCKKHNGIGLSANQCGYEYRVFVMGSGDNYVAFYNPEIISVSEKTNNIEEGCLSFPELRYETRRAMKAVAKGFNMYGEPVTVEGTEFLARALQHETDHLDGIVFIDRLSDDLRKEAMKEIRNSDWFLESQSRGLDPKIRISPHRTNGQAF